MAEYKAEKYHCIFEGSEGCVWEIMTACRTVRAFFLNRYKDRERWTAGEGERDVISRENNRKAINEWNQRRFKFWVKVRNVRNITSSMRWRRSMEASKNTTICGQKPLVAVWSLNNQRSSGFRLSNRIYKPVWEDLLSEVEHSQLLLMFSLKTIKYV